MKLDTSTDPQVGFRPAGSLDISTALDRYAGPFTMRHAAHVLRRSGFGGTPAEVASLATLGAQGSIDELLHPADPDVDFAPAPATALSTDPKTRNDAAESWWLDRMLRTRHPLFEKMTLFWHGHFATSIRKVPAPLMVAQIDLLRAHALGNFGTLLLRVSRDPAMLVWLDNRYNNKAHPNENYAREVMELFALGLGNYTEDDVKNAARAFTGWTLDGNLDFVYRAAAHDTGPKTFLGRTGTFTGEDVIATIVQQPIHQRFICRKLLEFFVYSDPEPELIEALARRYALCGGDVGQTVGTLLRSNVFFSTRAYRAIPKSPIEFTIGLLRFMGVGAVPPDTIGWLRRMGQEPLAPPSVKGWDGGPTWINTATLLTRFNYVNRIVRASPPKPAPIASTATAGMAMPMQVTSMQATPPSPAAYPALTPDVIVRQAGGLDADRVLAAIETGAVQNDLTSDVRAQLRGYLESSRAGAPVPFGPENYEDKIRGALALTLNLPSNQLN